MSRPQVTRKRLIKGALIASVIAAICALAAHRTGMDVKSSLESLKTTAEGAAKDIRIPQPISAADANAIIERIVKKGRKVSKKFYKDLEKEAAKQTNKAHGKLLK